jgi:hypothetical protein
MDVSQFVDGVVFVNAFDEFGTFQVDHGCFAPKFGLKGVVIFKLADEVRNSARHLHKLLGDLGDITVLDALSDHCSDLDVHQFVGRRATHVENGLTRRVERGEIIWDRQVIPKEPPMMHGGDATNGYVYVAAKSFVVKAHKLCRAGATGSFRHQEFYQERFRLEGRAFSICA